MKPHVDFRHVLEVAVRRIGPVIEWAPSNRRLCLFLWVWRHAFMVIVYLDGDPNEALRRYLEGSA